MSASGDTPAAAALGPARWFDGRSSQARAVLVGLHPAPGGPSLSVHPVGAPGGAARLISMSREGPARPVPSPATEATTSATMPGSSPEATTTSSAAEPSRHTEMIFSSRCTRPTRKPPTSMPAAPHSM